MPSFNEPRMHTFIAGEDLSSAQYKFVKFGADEKTVLLSTVLGAHTVGILQNAPASGQAAEVALPGGGAKLKVAGTVVKLAYLSNTAAALGDTALTTHQVGAQAYEAGVANDVINVEVMKFLHV